MHRSEHSASLSLVAAVVDNQGAARSFDAAHRCRLGAVRCKLPHDRGKHPDVRSKLPSGRYKLHAARASKYSRSYEHDASRRAFADVRVAQPGSVGFRETMLTNRATSLSIRATDVFVRATDGSALVSNGSALLAGRCLQGCDAFASGATGVVKRTPGFEDAPTR